MTNVLQFSPSLQKQIEIHTLSKSPLNPPIPVKL